ncbi:MAG: chloride channel protein [Anaerolineales bacterium]|nr:MAG: chloride channel protein [Anaerolineales bacterium]
MKKQQRLLIDSILLGIVGGLSAQLFTWLLHLFNNVFMVKLAGYIPPGLPEEGGALIQSIGSHGLWLVPVTTTLGGLISGILVYSLAPEAEGHGTDTAVKAYHRSGGFIRARVPPLKMLASAITIGSGGAAGREGPTALISAGVGSAYGTLTKRSEDDRRALLLIGMASGLSAIFRSPIGTAFFAVEVLYSSMEFDAWVLLYTMLGSIVAYTVNGLFVGWQPLFSVPSNIAQPDFLGYLWYAALGIVAGLIGVLLPEIFYRVRDMFQSIPIPPHVKPAIGGLGVGLLALALPQILGGGYGWIQEAIDGNLTLSLMGILILAKIIALALTISSGGSGGVFAPGLFVGAMLGGTLAKIFHQPDAAFVIVGMAAVFAGAARVPIATLLMVTEMTGGYQLLVPAALAIMVAYVVQRQFAVSLKYPTLYEGQVVGRPDSPAHQIEHLETAIRLLARRKVNIPENISHVSLQTLIDAGIPIDLPEDRMLLMGAIRKGSDFIGQPASTCFPPEQVDQIDLVGIFRGVKLLFPGPGLRIRADDRLLLISTPNAWERKKQHFHD